jgi:N6-L-threonylcarbamoyladenine synthase
MTRILGVETSCDETAAAVVADRRDVLSSIVASQIEAHREYGGVVPEIAARRHVEAIGPVIREALEEARCSLDDVDAIAVTHGPGLIGSLLVGLCAAKAIAWQRGLPLLAINHLEGHIRSAFIEHEEIELPAVALVVSGGHTALYLCPEEGVYRLLARTRDDAAGEAFDKVAKLLGLGYPGGPVIERVAREADEKAFRLPQARMKDGSLDFSFRERGTWRPRFSARSSRCSCGGRCRPAAARRCARCWSPVGSPATAGCGRGSGRRPSARVCRCSCPRRGTRPTTPP